MSNCITAQYIKEHYTNILLITYIHISIYTFSFYISTALCSLAIKVVTAVKALQLLDDLYKLSQLRLAVTAGKAVQELEELY